MRSWPRSSWPASTRSVAFGDRFRRCRHYSQPALRARPHVSAGGTFPGFNRMTPRAASRATSSGARRCNSSLACPCLRRPLRLARGLAGSVVDLRLGRLDGGDDRHDRHLSRLHCAPVQQVHADGGRPDENAHRSSAGQMRLRDRMALFVMDASKRSAHGNAYFSGFGKAKQIVFFDTLLEKHSQEEITWLYSPHELGHYKFGHILQRIGETALLRLRRFLRVALGFCSRQSGGSLRARLHDPGLVLIVVLTAMGPLSQLVSPVTNYLSRRAEFQADGFAKRWSASEPMTSALTKLSRDNLSDADARLALCDLHLFASAGAREESPICERHEDHRDRPLAAPSMSWPDLFHGCPVGFYGQDLRR